MADLNSNTIEGLLEYCDYLMEKGYAPPSQVEPWKTAIKKVFYTVLGEDYAPTTLNGLDLEDSISRFRNLANGQYKHESITAYQRRVQNALDAYAYFLENNRPPAFRQVKRNDGDPKAKKLKPVVKKDAPAAVAAAPTHNGDPASEFFDLSYPLDSGQMATMRLPKRMSKEDADRITLVIRTLQRDGQRQLPPGDEHDLAA